MSAPISPVELKNPVNFLALGLGSGLVPKMPGTAGSLLAIIVTYFFPIFTNALVLLLLVLSGIWICQTAANNLKVHDHPAIVWDEFCGIWLTLVLIQWLPSWIGNFWNHSFSATPVIIYTLTFISFRIFDIYKPWPIKYIDRHVKGGLGIMLDDLLAAFYASITVIAIIIMWNQLP